MELEVALVCFNAPSYTESLSGLRLPAVRFSWSSLDDLDERVPELPLSEDSCRVLFRGLFGVMVKRGFRKGLCLRLEILVFLEPGCCGVDSAEGT